MHYIILYYITLFIFYHNILYARRGRTQVVFSCESGGTGYISTTPVTITQSGATASNYVATVSATGTITAISGGTSSGFSYFTTPPVIVITTSSARRRHVDGTY
jgi:hypothetical protein